MDLDCSICLYPLGYDQINSDRIAILSCSHCFHSSCIKNLKKKACPNCRADLSSTLLPIEFSNLLRPKETATTKTPTKVELSAPELDNIKIQNVKLQKEYDFSKMCLEKLHRDLENKNNQIEDLSLQLQEQRDDSDMDRNQDLIFAVQSLEASNLLLDQRILDLQKQLVSLKEIQKMEKKQYQSDLDLEKSKNKLLIIDHKKSLEELIAKQDTLEMKLRAIETIKAISLDKNILSDEWEQRLAVLLDYTDNIIQRSAKTNLIDHLTDSSTLNIHNHKNGEYADLLNGKIIITSTGKGRKEYPIQSEFREIISHMYSKLEMCHSEYQTYKKRAFKLSNDQAKLKEKLQLVSPLKQQIKEITINCNSLENENSLLKQQLEVITTNYNQLLSASRNPKLFSLKNSGSLLLETHGSGRDFDENKNTDTFGGNIVNGNKNTHRVIGKSCDGNKVSKNPTILNLNIEKDANHNLFRGSSIRPAFKDEHNLSCHEKSTNKIPIPGSANKRRRKGLNTNVVGDGLGGVLTSKKEFFRQWINKK